MDIKKEFKFSPSHTLEDIRKENVIEAFKERIEAFYFKPIEKLLKKQDYGFAATTLIANFIDILDKTSRHDKENKNNTQNYTRWLEHNLNFDPKVALDFYKNLRCGLIHSGCIESSGKISYSGVKLYRRVDDYFIINPKILFKNVKKKFYDFIENEDPANLLKYLSERLDELHK